MPALREIRARYDGDTITMYQAYHDAIADPALAAGRFVPPFSFRRMTWIKPSFLWLMHRSNWAQKKGQERVLAVTMTRQGFESALAQGVLTSFEPKAHGSPDRWHQAFENANVHVQWDTERTLRGAKLPYDSLQVGLSRHVITEFVDDWIVSLDDLTPTVRKIHQLIQSGKSSQAKRFLPSERIYPMPPACVRSLQADG